MLTYAILLELQYHMETVTHFVQNYEDKQGSGQSLFWTVLSVKETMGELDYVVFVQQRVVWTKLKFLQLKSTELKINAYFA